MTLRKISLFTSFSVLCLGSCIAQWGVLLPNEQWENWSKIELYDDPVDFQTFNYQSYFTVLSPNVTKVPGTTGSAIRLETSINPLSGAVAQGLLTNYDIINNRGGQPWDMIPDSFTADIKYHTSPGDTISLYCIFKRLGFPISINIKYIIGDQLNFTRFSFPIEKNAIAPDSMLFIALTGTFNKIVPGTFLELDNIRFINSTSQLLNSGFEKWETIGFEEPNGWASQNLLPAIFRQTVPVRKISTPNGKFALQLEHVRTLFNGTYYNLSNCGLGDQGSGTFKSIAANISTVPAKQISINYNYAPKSNLDTAYCIAVYTKFNTTLQKRDTIQLDLIALPASANPTTINYIPNIQSPGPFDSVWVAFSASHVNPNLRAIGSVLTVHNIQLRPSSSTQEKIQDEFMISPNPVQDVMQIQSTTKMSISNIQIYNSFGSLMVENSSFQQISDNQIALQMSDLPTGMYVIALHMHTSTKFINFIKI